MLFSDHADADGSTDRFHVDDLSFDHPPPQVRSSLRTTTPFYATQLRRELNQRALLYARTHQHLHDTTPGASPSIVFGQAENGQHGNFFPASYRAILANPGWAARLAKVHTAHRRNRARADWSWRELDTASSSDALLMNIFCYPGVLDGPASQPFRVLLGIPSGVTPEFGYHPHIPFANDRFDRTEIDLRLGSLLIEAKLTESNFQTAKPSLIRHYRDVHEVFDLPEAQAFTPSYQLLRGVLAAHAEPTIPPASFCVLADARRPDLLEAWYTVMATVRLHDLRCRLQMLTWQEVATTLPNELRSFVEEKYGIGAAETPRPASSKLKHNATHLLCPQSAPRSP